MNGELKTEPPRPISPAEIASDWTEWGRRLLTQNQLPFSGDVSQWITAWGEAVGQIGLFNLNITGARDPAKERAIIKRYSYGHQLGEILAVLTPMADEFYSTDPHKRSALSPASRDDYESFVSMRDGIQELKNNSPSTVQQIVEAIKRMKEKSPSTYRRTVDELVDELKRL
ncbi:hypothetical protein OKW50_008377 [Paraburkholderia youngii]|uniref:hypothetical protein n=1 Tax=Paraburkholderia youngii TaxID=2782701 RepID=UPI003D22A3BC